MRPQGGWLAVALSLATFATARGQGAPSRSVNQIDSIVVTAQKQEQSTNTVAMSVTALGGEDLRHRGIDAVSDLPRLVPGLTLQESAFNSTSLTLRGVGFFNSDLSTPPAVTVYVDEAPLPYPAMTKLAAFDLARVEVLKGPQGTLYGENATGGAVNYIAAKPTDTPHVGTDFSFGTFNRLQVGAFASGPINDQLKGRLAFQIRHGDSWQKSVTRPWDRLGYIAEIQARGTLEWNPVSQFTSRLTFTFTHDGSDGRAGQFAAPIVNFPTAVVPGLLNFPVVSKQRYADWTPTRPDTNAPFPYRSDTTLYQTSWRNDYRIDDDTVITSLTSYASFDMRYGQDQDGTPFHIGEVIDKDGSISSFSQELRLAGRWQKFRWLVGANYKGDSVSDAPLQFFADSDAARLFLPLDPQAYADESQYKGRLRADTYAVFGRVEFELNDRLTLEAALRYNIDRRSFDNCAFVATDHLARFWNIFRAGAQPPTRVGDCYVVDPANGLQPVSNVHNTLNQDSVPWKVGFQWTAAADTMMYANISQGYKAGAVAVLAASTVNQFRPVPQEDLLAYEAGIKAGLLDNRVQLNAAIFYYDYSDKQLRGSVRDPAFGPLEALVSIPKSHVEGAEAQLIAHPIPGLTLDAAATYIQTEVDQFVGFDALANFGDRSHTSFPFSPKWQTVSNLDYQFPFMTSIDAFVGITHTYNSKTFTGVGALDLLKVDSFNLIDLRAGVDIDDGRYRIWAWGKNVANEYYWTNTFANSGAMTRFLGQPATFGLSFSSRF